MQSGRSAFILKRRIGKSMKPVRKILLPYQEPPINWLEIRHSIYAAFVLLFFIGFCLWAINPDSWQFN
jgi:hypothetical protein